MSTNTHKYLNGVAKRKKKEEKEKTKRKSQGLMEKFVSNQGKSLLLTKYSYNLY